MEEKRSIFQCMAEMQRLFFDCARAQMGNRASIHPKQGPVLGFLLCRGHCSQADLVRELHVSAATVAVSISRLERLGYVRRERNKQNQRANVISLTDTGRAEALKLQAALREVSHAALMDFNAEELDTIERYCERISANLRAHYHKGEEQIHSCEKC